MPRTLTTVFQTAINAQASEVVTLIFLTFSHSSLADPIRVVSDTKDYSYDGFTWTGFPFKISILTDDDQPPLTKLEIQNVDERIGQSLQNLTTDPLRMKMEILSSADFNMTDPRTPIGTPDVEYLADRLYLRNVKVDILSVVGDVAGWDYVQRTWPGIRATQARLPGLFR